MMMMMMFYGSGDNLFIKVTGRMLDSRLRFSPGTETFATTPTSAVGINQPSIKWIPGASSKLDNRLGHEAPSISKIQQTLCIFTSTSTTSCWEAVIRIRGTDLRSRSSCLVLTDVDQWRYGLHCSFHIRRVVCPVAYTIHEVVIGIVGVLPSWGTNLKNRIFSRYSTFDFNIHAHACRPIA
jgi:hypothetical protein